MEALEDVARLLQNALALTPEDDPLHECGRSCTVLLEHHPQDVLELAYQKLNCWPFADSPLCWRRLYEEASLYKAFALVKQAICSSSSSLAKRAKRRRLDVVSDDADISELVAILDKAVIVSGAPCRLATIYKVFGLLRSLKLEATNLPNSFPVHSQNQKGETQGCEVLRSQRTLSFAAFQRHLDISATPILMTGLVSEWPAFEHWKDPRFWWRLTLGGRRLIPVEIGRSYTDEDWGQQLMTFERFLDDYLLPCNPKSVGYLAQHDLFQQFPELRHDTVVPDYCYSTPPEADPDVLKTAGLFSVAQLDAPLTNVWFGPKGTKTPLHTDPYHNILCQVVGYKYVRLYPPSETAKLYPHGVNDKGINMENTSRIDVDLVRPDPDSEVRSKIAIRKDFPLFENAQYQEAILGPGECLYVPLGWWHYVEGLSTSFSVSFWWN